MLIYPRLLPSSLDSHVKLVLVVSEWPPSASRVGRRRRAGRAGSGTSLCSLTQAAACGRPLGRRSLPALLPRHDAAAFLLRTARLQPLERRLEIALGNTEIWGHRIASAVHTSADSGGASWGSGVSALAFNLKLRSVYLFTICLC